MLAETLVPDDEDPKTRRNLVMFSSALLLLAWLQVPLSAVAEKLGVSSAAHLQPFRVWSAAAVVLLYLAVRFHFSGGGKEAFNELKKLYGSQLHWVLHPKLSAASALGPVPWVTPPLGEVIQRGENAFAGQNYAGAHRRDILVQPVSTPEDPGWRLSGSGQVVINWLNTMRTPETHIYQHVEPVTYMVPLRARIAAVTRAVWLSWFFSTQAVGWAVPFWLASLASGLVGWRLGKLLYSVA